MPTEVYYLVYLFRLFDMGTNKFESLKGDYIESEYNTIYEFIIAITKQ